MEIVGKIEECPRAVNSHRFRIDWRKNNGLPLPANLLPEFLEEYYPNDFATKEKLPVAVARYNEVYGGKKKDHTILPILTAHLWLLDLLVGRLPLK